MKLWTRIVTTAALFAATVPGAAAQTEAAAPKTPLAAVKAKIAEYDAAQAAFLKRYGAAETDEERSAIVAESLPDAAEYTPDLWALAEAHPGSEAELEALVWLGQHVGDDAEVRRVYTTLIENHLESERIAKVLERTYLMSSQTADVVESLISESRHRPVQGQACRVVAQYWKGLSDGGDEHALERAVELYGAMQAEYADVKALGSTLGQLAENALFEIHNLRIGMAAPEIEGNDIDDVAFKLSDYRGKVVVLDFWGDW